MLDWNDLRPVLAVARTGTLAAAAKSLRIDATTVGRRIQSAENALGVRLFDRIDGRYSPTPAGEIAIRHGEVVEKEILSLEGVVAGQDQALEGEVRLTAVSSIVNHLLVPMLPQLMGRHPDLRLELVASNANLNLTRREADLALRLGRPNGGAERLRKVGVLHYAVYGPARRAGEADALPWLGYDEALEHVPEAAWLKRHIDPGRSIVVRATELETLSRLVLAGLGKAVLPLLLGEGQAGLVRLSGPKPVISRDLWLVIHPELRKTARVSAVIDWIIGDCMKRLKGG